MASDMTITLGFKDMELPLTFMDGIRNSCDLTSRGGNEAAFCMWRKSGFSETRVTRPRPLQAPQLRAQALKHNMAMHVY